MKVLGISALYHDSAAALIVNGKIVAAAQEERFTRIKHDPSFPLHAIRFVLSEADLRVDNLDAVAFYDKPILKLERLLESYHAFAPVGFRSFLNAMPVWMKEKLFVRESLNKSFEELGQGVPKRYLFPEHHLSHAASAFYPSPYEDAAILTVDGVGEWATTTIAYGKGESVKILKELRFPHSPGLLYSAFTYYCGFKVNSGEYKLMGLAPYAHRESVQVQDWVDLILEKMIDVRPDGSLLLNLDYFDFVTGSTMCNDKRWYELFNLRRRDSESELTQPYMDLAQACQIVVEKIVLAMVDTAHKLTGSKNLVMAGGVALNCVANARVLRDSAFKNLWVQPAAGDAGGALGAALAASHISLGCERTVLSTDGMNGTYLGPDYSGKDLCSWADTLGARYQHFESFEYLADHVAELLANGEVVGWFQGKMEFGPRALGNRSILADPRKQDMQKRLNLKIKFRESFRPFAPSVQEEYFEEFFDSSVDSPYMLLVADVKDAMAESDGSGARDILSRLYENRSSLPAITHVDNSARIQTVNRKRNPRYWTLLDAFRQKTGVPILVNTSFNVRNEPIVCSPGEAYRCFMSTDMDYLVVENLIFRKSDQPEWQEESYHEEYALD